MHKFTIGCDPEFFLRERKSGKLISAIPHINGTKQEPHRLPLGGNIQRDNVAVEVATDPADSQQKFVDSISNTLKEAIKLLPENTEIVALPSACFDQDQLDHPEALAFGCEPDYCAWDVKVNEKPYANDITFRSCGAHIHVGTDGSDGNEFLLDFEGKIATVRVMDCVLGIASTILDSGKDAIDRRQLYGKPGAHRPKDYGVEYRVLSNFWLKSPVTVMMIYHMTKDCLDIVRAGESEALVESVGENEVRTTISTGDQERASKIMERYVIPKLSEDSMHYFNEALSKIQNNDMHFHKEWNLYSKEVIV